MIVIDSLLGALRSHGLHVIEYPQSATNTTAHLELKLVGFGIGGEKRNGESLSYETMTFSADVVASGIGHTFVSLLAKTLRIMMTLGETSLTVPFTVVDVSAPGGVKTINLVAHLTKQGDGRFEYPDSDAPMPVEFREPWRIVITYPASIVPEGEDV